MNIYVKDYAEHLECVERIKKVSECNPNQIATQVAIQDLAKVVLLLLTQQVGCISEYPRN